MAHKIKIPDSEPEVLRRTARYVGYNTQEPVRNIEWKVEVRLASTVPYFAAEIDCHAWLSNPTG
jgi:hypothetical protein